MGKRIRHLEFYGFPDQNVFTTIGSVDLSEIEKINQEQDEEISEISGATKGKADLSLVNEVSAKTDAFIGLQRDINEHFAEAISANTERITALEEYDEEVADKINEVISSITAIDDDIETLSGDVEELRDMVIGGSGATEAIEALSGAVEDLQDTVNGKLDKDEAEETYAKKEDVYTKEETDELLDASLSGITDDIEYLSGMVDTLQEEIDNLPTIDTDKFALKTDLNELSGSFATYSAATDESINDIEESISSITSDISTINGKITSIEGDIEDINTELGKKLDKTTFTDFASDVEDMFNVIEREKATKEELSAVSGSVSQLRTDLQTETTNREEADADLLDAINAVDAKADTIVESVASVSGAVDSLSDRLDQEIQDRIDGDIALIGTSSDTMSDDTIWGAKKYAVYQRTSGVQEAKVYTDEKFSGIETYIDNELDRIDTDVAKKADKTYVDEVVNDKVDELRDDLTNSLNSETIERRNTDSYLQSEIDEINDLIYSGWSADTQEIYNRLNVITTYSGDSPDHYVNTGNGVLDVLHREFHELEDEIGIVTNPTLQRNNEYESAFGTYNISHTGELDSEKTIFSVGIGTSDDNRKNAIEIMKDGTLYLWVEGEYMNVNDLLSMLAHETYN